MCQEQFMPKIATSMILVLRNSDCYTGNETRLVTSFFSGTVNLLSCQSPSTPLVSIRVTLPSFKVTRSVNNLNIPCCCLATGQRHFAYRWVKIWNGLSKHLRALTSYDNFKQCIFREYLSKSC